MLPEIGSQEIPGIAGKDYPVFGQSLLQRRRFACRGLEGYFADISARCQVRTQILYTYIWAYPYKEIDDRFKFVILATCQ